MTTDELAVAIGTLGSDLSANTAQLQKALDEIKAEIANMGTVPQAVTDALGKAQEAVAGQKAVAQALDDLNPDAPAPTP